MTAELKYDLHVHSRNSYDCFMRAERIVRVARKRGLAGIAVTDHGTIAGGLEASAVAPADLLVIIGAEIYTEVGDIVGLFLREEIRSRDPIDVIAQIHDQGGIAFLPHPLRHHPEIPEGVVHALDGYETLNSRAGRFLPGDADPNSPLRQLAQKTVFGCSDAHFYSEIGTAYTTIAGPPTCENVADQIRTGQTESHGTKGPAINFYRSQLVKAIKRG